MKTLFTEGDLKNAGSEVAEAIDKSNKAVVMATCSFVFQSRAFSKAIKEALEGYKEAKAILEEIREFTTDEYTKALIDEIEETILVKTISLENLCMWLESLVNLINKQVEALTNDTGADAS